MNTEFAARLQARSGDWGRIISLTSGGEKGFPGEVSYGAAKAALMNYTLAAFLVSEAGRRMTGNVIRMG